jgi:cytochrome c-type biogenesis protein
MDFSLAAIFGAGLLTFASPCVLPLMPVYLATIAGGAVRGEQRGRTLLLAGAFSLGLALVFVTMGALASSVGGALVTLRLPLLLLSGGLMVLFGLRAFGLLRIGALDVDARPALHRVERVSGIASAFLFGAAFGLGWSPCIGPVLASVLTYTATHADTPMTGAGYLALYAAGLALPLLVLAAVAERATSWLKRSRGAIPRLEKVTAAALVGVGIWTLASALPTTPSEPAQPVAAASNADKASCDGDTDGLCGLPDQAAAAQQGSVEQLEGAQLLEFTAHDCPVCKRMRPVLDRLVASCGELEQRIVRVDVTTKIGRSLADRHAVRGTPTFVLIDDAGSEVVRLLGERSRAEVADAIERTFGLSCWG